MYAIISELDQESSVVVKDLWGRLREACGLMAIYELPTPHFTWFVAENLDVPAIEDILAELSASTCLLTSYVFGFGIFSGERPVFYLPLVKSQAMIDLHNEIWRRSIEHSEQPNPYLSPSFWMPHITLAINDITRESLACALESVAFDAVEMEVSGSNLIVVSQSDASSTMTYKRFYFKSYGSVF
ncbi:MAG TPA: 2'-5' RNA ligase family protein [Brevefilum sp.]|nr:2'-5' RNA ligase family protein [Brevefilum sp.]HOR18853.1 2'-5' RNA ligase family protein [Brevefilum sp.]HPL69683.1 2'-5' RNA ligase family protein [Brevefilum sp.]